MPANDLTAILIPVLFINPVLLLRSCDYEIIEREADSGLVNLEISCYGPVTDCYS